MRHYVKIGVPTPVVFKNFFGVAPLAVPEEAESDCPDAHDYEEPNRDEALTTSAAKVLMAMKGEEPFFRHRSASLSTVFG